MRPVLALAARRGGRGGVRTNSSSSPSSLLPPGSSLLSWVLPSSCPYADGTKKFTDVAINVSAEA